MRPATMITVMFLLLVALLHVMRVAFAVPVSVDGTAIPMWPSALACVALPALALWLWKEQRGGARPA